MASELRVNTLKDASGNNSIGLSYVAEGSAKAWVNFNGSSVTSDADLAGVRDSFNLTSIVDNGTGDHSITIANNMSNANYAHAGSSGGQNGTSNGNVYAYDQQTARTATLFRIATFDVNGTFNDTPNIDINVHGDLA